VARGAPPCPNSINTIHTLHPSSAGQSWRGSSKTNALRTYSVRKRYPKVTEETLALSLDYLKQHLEVPCQLTGIESRGCFAWEESYIFGRRRPKEYAQRKKQQPSYTDTYALLRFEEAYDAYEGIDVQVKRISDKKRFVLPLAALKATEEQSKNYQLLHDYVVWFVNWRR
jgi:hypothetical protein